VDKEKGGPGGVNDLVDKPWGKTKKKQTIKGGGTQTSGGEKENQSKF